jgi:hypothetical protein
MVMLKFDFQLRIVIYMQTHIILIQKKFEDILPVMKL